MIFIGFDPSEAGSYFALTQSIRRHDSVPGRPIRALCQQSLRLAGLYCRVVDPLASTEFTYTRFLVPHLAGYQGWALFMDGDMLCREDIAGLFALADDRYALMCVQHDYRPDDTVKMGGRTQTQYPRKNWSSLVLWNCGHPANRAITPQVVNTQSGAFLHRFQWLDDSLIGALPERWNWLEGWSSRDVDPAIVHFTRGIPGIHDGMTKVPYAEEFFDAVERSL